MPNILLLSKDTDYIELMLYYFENNEINIKSCNSIKECNDMISSSNIDVVICDHEYGSVSVTQIAEIIHKIDNSIIMVSLEDCFSSVNLQNFLSSNIKEFICKRIDIKLTMQRLMFLLNNKNVSFDDYSDCDLMSQAEKIKINYDKKMIYHNSEAIHVTQLEFDLLVLFLENKNKLLTREEIIENVWRESRDGNLRKVDAFIKELRKKLNLKSIKSVRGLGYRWLE
ncbi:DNA-binding response OmpR family regulator [Bacilli bacterium PM5-3]|nr:DNA-binding response OmpR family regulator [Bacilli bacterium PM5-3]MDH6603585.1 DNA-binding response OmpR family regulator [Bacilli bacterium PM5-9]